MDITPIRTRTLVPPKDSFLSAIQDAHSTLPESSVVALSSKAVAIGEGRCIPIPDGEDVRVIRRRLAEAESELFTHVEGNGFERCFTITHGSLVGSAGIDESNGNGYLILWPEDPMRAAAEYLKALKKIYRVAELGIIIVDSHSTPLHNGAIGVAIGYAGFAPVRDYRGSKDLFGRAFRFERSNIADGLAAAANCVMGEGNESTPGSVITQVPGLVFTEEWSTDPLLAHTIRPEDDYFGTFLNVKAWQKGGGGYSV